MRPNGAKAAAWMRRWSLEGRTGVQGYCLRTCREAWGLPGDEASAIKEWHSIPADNRFKTRWSQIPVGAPVFFEGGEFGHVALASGIPGFVWSTDAPKADRIGLVHMSWFARRWRYRYLGWADQFQNQKLPLKGRP